MILPFFDHLSTSTWTFFTLNVDKNGDFWTTYPPHLVDVVIERPQRSIGICAREYAALKGSSKTEVKNSVKNLSEKLNVFNGLIKLQGKDIIDLVPVNRGHLQQLKNRLK